MPELRHTAKARADLLDIWHGIAFHNENAADRVLDRIETRVRMLTRLPFAGRPYRAISPEARILLSRPYIILYRVLPDAVQIVRVLHGARDINETLFREGFE